MHSIFSRIVIVALVGVCCLNFTWSQHDVFFGLESADGNTEYEEDHSSSSCKWTDPPDEGFNFKPCATGICKGAKGSYSKNGTVRFTRCKKHFVLAEGFDKDVCDNGQWSSSGHKCIPCGVSSNRVNPLEELALIHHGRNASVGDFPWMVGLYTPLDGSWEQICGGTLIAPHLVLTAAHCFQISGNDLKPNAIKVGLGKIAVDINQKESVSKIMTVKEILKPERYVGIDHLYDLDLAVLVLSSSVEISRNIMPACVDWSAIMGPKHDETGYLAGYGITEHGSRSDRLKWAFQKFIAYDNCRKLISTSDQKFVTHDKFCTAEVKGSKADKGDSGGGLTFVRDGVHYVYGIVSTKLNGDDKNLRLFTSLMNDGDRVWLQKVWIRLQVRHGISECSNNQDCPDYKVCASSRCVDPCSVVCGPNTNCRMVKNVATCACKVGYAGDPIKGCMPAANCHSDPGSQKKYKLYNNKVNWFQALQNCALEGKRLAIVRTPEEQQLLNEAIGDQRWTSYWLGGSDLAKEGNFFWIDNFKPFTWKNFRPGNPDNFNKGEHCLEAWGETWNDIDCNRAEYYICEYF